MITVLKIVADARIFFRKEQLPFVAVALIAAETGWEQASSPGVEASKVAQALNTILHDWAALRAKQSLSSRLAKIFLEPAKKTL